MLAVLLYSGIPIDATPSWVQIIMAVIGAFVVFCIGLILLGSLYSNNRGLIDELDDDHYQSDVKAKSDRLVALSDRINDGCATYLSEEYFYLLFFIVTVGSTFGGAVSAWEPVIFFLTGAVVAGFNAYWCTLISAMANSRVVSATNDGIAEGFGVAYKATSIMGFFTESLALAGIAVLHVIFQQPQWMPTYALGASMVCLFARVSGGIFSKGANVGHDLIGKVEKTMTSRSADNPCVIANCVGQNIVAVHAVSADLFETYSTCLSACIFLGSSQSYLNSNKGEAFPLWLGGFACIIHFIAYLCTFIPGPRSEDEEEEFLSSWTLQVKILRSLYISQAVELVLLTASTIGAMLLFFNDFKEAWWIWGSYLLGLYLNVAIAWWSSFATTFFYSPTQAVANQGRTGASSVLIRGFGYGLLNVVVPLVLVFSVVLASAYLTGSYGVAIMSYGYIINAGSLVSWGCLAGPLINSSTLTSLVLDEEYPDERKLMNRCDGLESTGVILGNRIRGICCVGSILAALSIINCYVISGALPYNQLDSLNFVFFPGVIFGAMLPFAISAISLLSVGDVSQSLVSTVRDQLQDPARRGSNGVFVPDHNEAIKVCTLSAIYSMFPFAGLAIFTPLVIGYILGLTAVGGVIVGVTVTGFLLDTALTYSGGSWHSAKRFVSSGEMAHVFVEKLRSQNIRAWGNDTSKQVFKMINFGHDSDIGKAVGTGETAASPFHEAAAPSINIILKTICLFSLIMSYTYPVYAYAQFRWWIGLILVAALLGFTVMYYTYRRHCVDEASYQTLLEFLDPRGPSRRVKSMTCTPWLGQLAEHRAEAEFEAMRVQELISACMDNRPLLVVKKREAATPIETHTDVISDEDDTIVKAAQTNIGNLPKIGLGHLLRGAAKRTPENDEVEVRNAEVVASIPLKVEVRAPADSRSERVPENKTKGVVSYGGMSALLRKAENDVSKKHRPAESDNVDALIQRGDAAAKARHEPEIDAEEAVSKPVEVDGPPEDDATPRDAAQEPADVYHRPPSSGGNSTGDEDAPEMEDEPTPGEDDTPGEHELRQ